MKPMQVDLTGRSAIVTGGATGIGRAISLGLARCGASVVVGYHTSGQAAEELVAEISGQGGTAIAIQADVTDEAGVRSLISSAKDRFGRLDILVANAGGPTVQGPTAELTTGEWDHALAVNCTSVFVSVKHAIPVLEEGTGRIIVNSSINARTGGGANNLSYAASKAAVSNMVRQWARELAGRRITVNGIAPGVIRTRLQERWTPPETYRKLTDELIPLRRDGLPEDCVGPVLLLASDDGSYITGHVIEINGGLSMP